MELRLQILSVMIVSIIAAILALWMVGDDGDYSGLTRLGIVTAVVASACLTFDRLIWHWPIFRKWAVKRPYIQGTWRVDLSSTYSPNAAASADVDRPSQNEPQPVPVDADKPTKKVGYMVIRQTFSSISFRFYTNTAKSHTLAYRICLEEDDLFSVWSVFLNEPNIDEKYSERSAMHMGALRLKNVTYDNAILEGEYFTERRTAGLITLGNRKSEIASSYAAAKALFED